MDIIKLDPKALAFLKARGWSESRQCSPLQLEIWAKAVDEASYAPLNEHALAVITDLAITYVSYSKASSDGMKEGFTIDPTAALNNYEEDLRPYEELVKKQLSPIGVREGENGAELYAANDGTIYFIEYASDHICMLGKSIEEALNNLLMKGECRYESMPRYNDSASPPIEPVDPILIQYKVEAPSPKHGKGVHRRSMRDTDN